MTRPLNSNSLTISSTSTVTTQFTVTRSPVNTHSFVSWSPGVANSNVTDASLLVNPSSAAADTNLLGLAVNSSPVFLVDADGDVFAKSVTLSGGATLATTSISGNVSIEGNTTLGDAPNNDTTLINGYTRLFATSTSPALTIWNSNSGNLLNLQTGSTQATNIFTVDHNGQTTIGTSTPAGLSTLTVAATTTSSIPLTLKGVTGQAANLFQALYSDNTSALTLTNTGLLGIGTSSPAFTLSVQGNALLGSTTVQGLTATGTIAVQGSGTSTFANGITTGGILSTNGLTVQGGSILSAGLLTVTNTGTSSFSGGLSTAGLSSSNGFTITTGNLNIPSGIFSVGGTGSSTITNGLTTGGLSSSNGLTITGGSFLSSVPFTNTSTATSTFSGGLTAATLNVTSSTASSTFSNGIRLTNGCFQDTTGTCVINPWTVGSGNISYSGGNVGVGTSTPAEKLDIGGGLSFSVNTLHVTNANIATIRKQSDYGLVLKGSTGSIDDFAVFTNGANVLIANPTGTNNTILNQSVGNVGIGTTSPGNVGGPTNTLTVAGSVGISNRGLDNSNSSTNQLNISRPTNDGSTAAVGIKLDSQGGNDVYQIYAASTFDIRDITAQVSRLSMNSSGNFRLLAYGAGTLTTDGSGNITASSDERLKDIQGPFTRGLADIGKINPIIYHWNATSTFDMSTLYAGFSAQNVQSAIPEAVGVGANGYLTLQDRPILAALVNGMKELNTKLDDAISGGTISVSSGEPSNAWSVDQSSGKVNVSFFGNINMQGNDILDVGKIAGMSGKWKIDEDGTLTAVKVATNEVLTESLSVKSSFELGSMEKPAGMTIYDRTTGEPYCVGIDIGEWFRQKGKCNSTTPFSQPLNPGIGYSTSPETAVATTSPTSSETASTTLPVETLSSSAASTTATTTEP